MRIIHRSAWAVRHPGLIWTMIAIPLLLAAATATWAGEPGPSFVGSKKCGDCHEEQYQNYLRYAKKAHSFASVRKMKWGLTESEYQGCLACHTTGYGRPGGFVSEEETPDLKDNGCEVCHGPGSVHVESEDPKDIKSKLSMEDCTTCHNTDRVGAFKFRPLIYGGGH